MKRIPGCLLGILWMAPVEIIITQNISNYLKRLTPIQK